MISVGFLHLDRGTSTNDHGYRCARALVQSVRRCMPHARIVQFTDQTSRGIKGVDAVRRKPSEPMGLLRMRHCAGVEGDWIFVDTDVLFQKRADPVFKRSFDVCLTTRDWSHVKPAPGFSTRMPFNTGVVFSRSPRFWAECYTRLRDFDGDKQQFMGEQEVINLVATDDPMRYHVRTVSGTIYNYPPMAPTDDRSSVAQRQDEAAAAILHFKGPERKLLMLQRIETEGQRCA